MAYESLPSFFEWKENFNIYFLLCTNIIHFLLIIAVLTVHSFNGNDTNQK